jgi:hypothetical protein
MLWARPKTVAEDLPKFQRLPMAAGLCVGYSKSVEYDRDCLGNVRDMYTDWQPARYPIH